MRWTSFASSAIEFEALYESDKYVQKCTHHITKTKKSHQKSQGSEFVEFWCLRRLKRLLDWRSRAKAAKKRQQANAVFSNLSLQISGVFLRQDRLSSGFHHRLKKSKAQLGHTKSFSFFLVSPVWAVLHVQFSMKKKSHLLKYRCVSVSNFCYFIQDFCQKKKHRQIEGRYTLLRRNVNKLWRIILHIYIVVQSIEKYFFL